MTECYRYRELFSFAEALLAAAGLPKSAAAVGAEVLVEGDLLDRTTHGLALLPGYLSAISDGTMSRDLKVDPISDTGAIAVWDGRRNLGPWLITQGLQLGMDRARKYGSFQLAIRRSHHIAALSAYLMKPVEQGFFVIVYSSDPSTASVAPLGGTEPMITPNPIAAGIPTAGRPLLIDISMSTTTNGFVTRAHRGKQGLPHAWLLDGNGDATNDPGVFFADPKGSILPLGGVDLGYKGFALGLLVEMFTSGLAGVSRGEPQEGWGASVFIQVLSPESFAGAESFRRQADWLVDAMTHNRRIAASSPIRIPGHRALELREQRLAQGVPLHPTIMPELVRWADQLGVAMPKSNANVTA